MNFNDIIIMVGAMLLSFLLGGVAMLFFGGRTALNYILVKASRGKKVLLFARTSFGWRSYVATKDANTLLWTYDKVQLITTIASIDDVSRYLRVDMAFVDANLPAVTISLKDGSFYPADFDPQTFNNLLIRAGTRPAIDGNDGIKKLLIGILLLLVVVGFGVVMIYVKLGDVVSGAGVVI